MDPPQAAADDAARPRISAFEHVCARIVVDLYQPAFLELGPRVRFFGGVAAYEGATDLAPCCSGGFP